MHGAKLLPLRGCVNDYCDASCESAVYLIFMCNEESSGATRTAIEKMAAGFVASLEERKPFTVILTTDGEKHQVTESSHPLPERYLEKWRDDCERVDIDLSL
jgi:hypothetical protein